jgi:hypothetical protein
MHALFAPHPTIHVLKVVVNGVCKSKSGKQRDLISFYIISYV